MAGMSIVRQLYELQEVELEAEATEQAISRANSQLGESPELIAARNKLEGEKTRLGGLEEKQRAAERESDDLARKITKAEDDLYSGRIRNPKELASLQSEAQEIKARRSSTEDKALQLMEEAEQSRKSLAALEREFRQVEADWRARQQQLRTELESLKARLAVLKSRQEQLAAGIDAPTLALFRELRKQKGTAVARVERGICGGCRISVPVGELQRARGGFVVRCGSCGRVFLVS